MYDLIILGGGPAGIAAGIYASRKRINTLLITKDFGGQSINAAKIENFIGTPAISGVELANRLESHLRTQNNIEIKDGVFISAIRKIDGGFEVEDSNRDLYKTKNVFIALGSSYKKLGIPGEKEYEGKGVFYCSICDAPLMKDKPAVVVGGGNSAVGSVIDLLPYASEIYLFVRGGALKADQILQERIKKEDKVKILFNSVIKEIIGEVLVKEIKYADLSANEEKAMNVSGVFVEIGYKPNTDLVKDLVNLNERGEIIINHQTMKTSQEGIWAAGDITDVLYDQINPAIGDGIKAVLNIYDNLNKR